MIFSLFRGPRVVVRITFEYVVCGRFVVVKSVGQWTVVAGFVDVAVHEHYSNNSHTFNGNLSEILDNRLVSLSQPSEQISDVHGSDNYKEMKKAELLDTPGESHNNIILKLLSVRGGFRYKTQKSLRKPS